MAILFLIYLDQICPKWIKLDQIEDCSHGSFFLNLIFLRKQNKNCPICENLIRERGKNGHFI